MKIVKTALRAVTAVLLLLMVDGCALLRHSVKPLPLNPEQRRTAQKLGLGEQDLGRMLAKPLYTFTEKEVDMYLGYLQETVPDLRARVQHLARKNLEQPYQLFVLGEHPFELYDAEPLYSLGKGDCVVFSEHIYAMALARDWRSFFILLQRIRYKNGEIGNLTRNHYTVADWNRNNSWLLEDMTEALLNTAAEKEVMTVDRAAFFRKYGIGQDLEPETVNWSYIPYERLEEVIGELRPGDFVNIVRGSETAKYVGHVGLITREGDSVNFLHSTWPRSKEQRLMELVETAEDYNARRRTENSAIEKENEQIRAHNALVEAEGKGTKQRVKSLKPYFYGFKFLRLRKDALERLRELDGPEGAAVYIREPWRE